MLGESKKKIKKILTDTSGARRCFSLFLRRTDCKSLLRVLLPFWKANSLKLISWSLDISQLQRSVSIMIFDHSHRPLKQAETVAITHIVLDTLESLDRSLCKFLFPKNNVVDAN